VTAGPLPTGQAVEATTRGTPGRRGRRVVRRWQDAGWLLAAVALLVLSALPVDEHRISGLERSVFRLVNNSLSVPFVLVWPVMQLGNIVAVPVAAAVAALARRFRLALSILIGGALTYELAKVVKHVVTRGRPVTLVPDVHIHGAAAKGLGFVSGHASVVALIAMVAFPYLGRRGRWAVGILAVAVCLARMYVGAHLLLDVVGGAALGLAVGAAMRLVFGRPAPAP
jgi:membrane-associated phospholipid phosphatase